MTRLFNSFICYSLCLMRLALIHHHHLIVSHSQSNNIHQSDNGNLTSLIVIRVIIVDSKLERLWPEKFILKKIAIIENKLMI